MLDDIDKMGVASLLTRAVRLQDERDAADKERDAANAKYHAANSRWLKCRTAFEIYGFDDDAEDFWDQIKAAIGPETWRAAIDRARNPDPPLIEAQPQKPTQTIEHQTSFLKRASDRPPAGKIKDLVIMKLREAGPEGMKAADIRKFIENAEGRQVHEKTVGMTLYRLSTEGIVRRDGRTWFLVSPAGDAENPGAGTPGLNFMD
jgi:hypothetical protein